MDKKEQDLKKKVKNLKISTICINVMTTAVTAICMGTLLDKDAHFDTFLEKTQLLSYGILLGMGIVGSIYQTDEYKQAKKKLKETANKQVRNRLKETENKHK